MEVKEIFDHLAQHMIKGMMIHESLANYYDFLGLGGYKRCHEYHYMLETIEYRGLCRYFINHYSMLIPDSRIDTPNIIPESWYNHVREDVDVNTKRSAIKSALEKWRDWETETKKLYQDMYHELMKLNEVAACQKIDELICGVDKELKKVQRYILNKEAIDYNMSSIISEQKCKHDKYAKKMRKLGVHIC